MSQPSKKYRFKVPYNFRGNSFSAGDHIHLVADMAEWCVRHGILEVVPTQPDPPVLTDVVKIGDVKK